MLRRLKIENYALIEHLELEFQPGFTIITGETGAGKSIMLGALSLILGGRADTRVIADGGSRSVVEAVFTGLSRELRSVFDSFGIDWSESSDGGEVIIRREISSAGRSRVFLNGCSVTLPVLSAVSTRLIDIHSQHGNAKINDPAEQLHIVDAFSDNEEILEEYQKEFARYLSLRRKIKNLKEMIARSAENEQFMRFQLDQLDRLKPKRGELEEIERKYDILTDADEIKERLGSMAGLLGDNGTGALTLVSDAIGTARHIDFSLFGRGDCSTICQRLEQVGVEIKDIQETLEEIAETISTDPDAIAKLSDRMDLYYDTLKRFKVEEADQLVDLYEDLQHKLGMGGGDASELPALEKEARAVAKVLKEKAERLSETRRAGAEILSAKILDAARPLGLPNIRFEARVENGKISANGQDTVVFLCSFNRQGGMMPLAEVASGGEISRMMLSLKGVLSGKMNLPTIIFDEVDTGVSGEIADKMGKMMRNMSCGMQVISITHLPQVAAKGDSHFKVFKRDEGTRTVTRVKELRGEDRVREIAGMMSGSSVGEAAMGNARVLLEENKGEK